MARALSILVLCSALLVPASARAQGEWELTPESEVALQRGLDWLARNQGKEGNWESNDLGLVSMGVLAFLSAGHTPGVGKYGHQVEKALDYVLRNARVRDDDKGGSGLLNIAGAQRDMYNHGLATFVLGQAHGMAGHPRMNVVLDRAIRLICSTQCDDGGWDYHARKQPNGHDLSIAVMQAKALRSAVDSGLDVPQEVIDRAIHGVRARYRSKGGKTGLDDDPQARSEPGQFTYNGGGGTLAMAACGVVCMQEYGQYDDWRIAKNMEVIGEALRQLQARPKSGGVPFDAYTVYYVGQALYQVGGTHWREHYPRLRDVTVANQSPDGSWTAVSHVQGTPGQMWGTSVACFLLAMPNRYLPILQEGKIESFLKKYSPQP